MLWSTKITCKRCFVHEHTKCANVQVISPRTIWITILFASFACFFPGFFFSSLVHYLVLEQLLLLFTIVFFSHEIISDHCFHYTHHENVFVIQILYNKPLYCNLWTLDHTRSRKSLERKENRQQNWHHIIFAVRDFLLLFSRLLFLQPQKVHFSHFRVLIRGNIFHTSPKLCFALIWQQIWKFLNENGWFFRWI